MQVPNPLLHSHKDREDEKVDRRNADVKDIVNNIHLVDPVPVDSRIPKELHHYAKLGQLRELTEEDEANIEPESPLVDAQLAAARQGRLDVPDGADQEDRRPEC